MEKSVLVVADGHYYVDEKGIYYVDSVFDYIFYSRYLQSFDNVYAIVRTTRIKKPNDRMKIASGNNVFFLPICESKGILNKFLNRSKHKKTIKEYLNNINVEAAIFRVPGVVANLVYSLWDKTKKYALEVVVDPWMYFSPGTLKTLYRPFVRVAWTLKLKSMCKKAKNISYVTEQYLQKKYPTKIKDGIVSYYSSVELDSNIFSSPKTFNQRDSFIISHAANSFSSYGKGHIILLKALKVVIESGYKADVLFIGDGKLKNVFEKKAHKLGIANHVTFLGKLSSSSKVIETLQSADLFVFPTKGEGLPRVLLEAMAAGLPALSTPICGIPEVLSNDCLIKYDDYKGFAKKIIGFICSPEMRVKCSAVNIETAKKYNSAILNQRRKEFYDSIKEQQ